MAGASDAGSGALAWLTSYGRRGPGDVDAVAPLFDAYRQFYQQPSDPALARAFIAERLARSESVIFLAERDGQAVGFVQLYPLFSSTAARPRRLWLLNDLFVSPVGPRRRGGARAHGPGAPAGRGHRRRPASSS